MGLDYKAIGRRIKTARVKNEITQEFLAEKVDLSAPHVSNIETGHTKLGLPTIVNIANALDVSVDELLCDNVSHSKAVLEKEAEALFADCSQAETRIMVDTLAHIKNSLRKYHAFEQPDNL